MAYALREYPTLREFSGEVIEIRTKYKGVVQFKNDKTVERALLSYNNLRVDGQIVPPNGSLMEYLECGTPLRFLCHSFDKNGKDRCQWFITCAWKHDTRGQDPMSSQTILTGLYNKSGNVVDIAPRQGTISCLVRDKDEKILFLASKVYFSGSRIPAKANLQEQRWIERGQSLMFDAVPCDPADNQHHCEWFATLVWKGRKPLTDYDNPEKCTLGKPDPIPKLGDIKKATSSPHSLFLRTNAQVMKIMNAEYGIALAAIKENRWETVLFHRSNVMLFDHSLTDQDLTQFFKEGDKLCVVAAASQKKTVVRWLASQVRVFVAPGAADLVPHK